MGKRALLVIDMLNDFVSPEGELYVGETAEEIIKRVAEEIAAFRETGDEIIYICDRHRPDDKEFEMFKPHCVAGSTGAKIHPALAPRPEEVVVPKRRYSAFFGTDLDLILKERGIEELVLTGVCTNICVFYTAADARMRGYEVSVLQDAVTSFDRQAHGFALQEMRNVLGVKVK